MALSKKHKCHFTEKIQQKIQFIRPCRPGQDDTVVHCTLCQSSFSIASGGRYSVVEHQQTKKHKKGLTANAVTPSITTFYKKTGPSQKEFELSVQEGILAYHTMKHNHSCRSMDCTAQLTQSFMSQSFHVPGPKVKP